MRWEPKVGDVVRRRMSSRNDTGRREQVLSKTGESEYHWMITDGGVFEEEYLHNYLEFVRRGTPDGFRHKLVINVFADNQYHVVQTDLHGVQRADIQCDRAALDRILPVLLNLEVKP